MINVSGANLSVTIVATQSFPIGFTIKTFADDADPIMVQDAELVGHDILMDGSLFAWQKGAAFMVSIGVIAGSPEDVNLQTLLSSKANGGFNILPIPDETIMTVTYGDGRVVAFNNGTIISGPLGPSVTTGHRMKGNVYTFAFGAGTPLSNGLALAGTVVNAVGRLF